VRHQVRGTLATSSQRYWKKFKCRQRLSMVSCIPHKALHCGHSKCSPATCSNRSSRRFGSPSKRHWATRHCRPRPQRCGKKFFWCHPAYSSPRSPKTQMPLASRTTAFAVDSPRRGTSQALSNAKCSYLPARSEACSREKRNKWQGPPLAGKMPLPGSALN
jgi:hypothetical protein